jgi:hypothetical protein
LATPRRFPILLAAALVLAGITIAPAPAAGYATGPPPDRIGLCSAGPTCKDSGCHDDFPLNSGLAVIRLQLAGPPPAPLPATFERGRNYRLLLDVLDPDSTRLAFGFEMAAVRDCPFARDAGAFTVLDPQRTREISDPSVHYVEHTCPSLSDPSTCGFLPWLPGGNSWEIEWSPACDLEAPVEFQAAVNAADGDSAQYGDRIYLFQAAMAPEAGCPGQVTTLTAVKQDCDPGTPGVLEAQLAWDPVTGANGYAVFSAGAKTGVRTICAGVLEAGTRFALTGPPLVFYGVAGLCASGSLGPM